MRPREVVILGSTGTIGCQALDVVARWPGRFRVAGLAAGGGQIERLADQVAAVQAPAAAVPSDAAAARLAGLLRERGVDCRITAGPDAASELARRPADVVLNGITGFAGLTPTLAALAAGRRLALANKESLVCGGAVVTRAAGDGQITPVDSEHSALAQARRAGRADEVRRLVLTASGGPFRGRRRSELAAVTVAEALAHPTWQMGRVVTVNSATLVNKGLEVIEAALLFNVPYDAIAVVVHPQSVVHSMVEFADGSTLAQASPPDMRLPIALGLSWPDRLADVAPPCDWSAAASWTFEPLDEAVFPAVAVARRAGQAAGTAPAVYNGANEVLVDAFCDGRIGFLDIVDTVAAVVEAHLAAAGGSAPAGRTASLVGGATAPTERQGDNMGDSLGQDGSAAAFVPDEALTLAAVEAADAWARRAASALGGGANRGSAGGRAERG
ncbi:MAG: 1-deoxy-D-xylulose-5-phosphate reductoisomerase [Propionibacteriaceae bacterium]|nr:1-deoxy-D-xylulose-5-phosphate reductoisomerase [Propionibacteriaceae bacterium]